MNRLFAFCSLFLATAVSIPAMGKAEKTPLEKYGRLRVENRQLVAEDGKPVQLRGMSTYNIAGFDWLFGPDQLKELVNDFHADVIRLAMYTDPIVQGYAANPERLTKIIDQLVEDTEAAGLYCIVDWHISNYDSNPNQRKDLSIAFFSRLAEKYKDKKHLFFEICNEPSGPSVTWDDVVRPYAVDVVAAIRTFDPARIVLVGNPTWSQDVDIAARHPLDDTQVMYTFHFYAGSHGQSLRDKVDAARKTVAVFCSEWGSTINTGDGAPFPGETAVWLKFLDERGISSANWSFSNVREGSAALIGSYDGEDPLKDSLTASGKILYDYLTAKR